MHRRFYMTAAVAAMTAAPAALAQSVSATPQTRFARMGELTGRTLSNPNDAELGTVHDFVVERGSGDIRYVIIERGGVLGIGSEQVALPWSGVQFALVGDAVQTDASLEQIKSIPTFDGDDWSNVDTDSWIRSIRGVWSDWTGDSEKDQRDPFAMAVGDAEEVTISGTIRRVRRDRSFDAAEHILVDIQAEDDGRQTVALGPAWFVMTKDNPPMRGESIEVNGLAMERRPDITAVAVTARIDGAEMKLRRQDGVARWTGDSAEEPRPPRMVLASDLVGADLMARGEDAGDIEELIIECMGGSVAFVEIDPDDAFLGIGDTAKVVPWETLSVGVNQTWLDASPTMLKAASPAPEKIGDLVGEKSQRDAIYRLFQVEPRTFEGGGNN